MVEEAQAFISLHHPLWVRRLIGARVLSAAMVPRANDSTLIIAEINEALDYSVGGAGIEPATPAVYGGLRLFYLRPVTVDTQFIECGPKRAVVAKYCLPGGGVNINVLFAMFCRFTVEVAIGVLINELGSRVSIQ